MFIIIEQKKISDIVTKYLGNLVQFSVCMMPGDKLKVTFRYKDQYNKLYEYVMIINPETDEVEFIKNKSKSLLKSTAHSIDEFEEAILEDLKKVF